MAARFNADGSLDTSFGNSGIVEVDFYYLIPGTENMQRILVQPDNKIVLAGPVGGTTQSWWGDDQNANRGIVRLNADGSIDTTFGNNGYVIENFIPDDINGLEGETATGLGLLPDGRIAVVGSYMQFSFSEPTQETILVSTLNPDGTPDQWMLGPDGWSRDSKIDSEGRIVGFGSINAPDQADFMVFRLFDDLTFDLSF